MTRQRDPSGDPPRRQTEIDNRHSLSEGLLDRLLLLVLLSLIPLRAILEEQATFEVPRWFRNLPAPGGSLPGTTLLLIGLMGAVGVALIALRLWRGGPAYRWTGAELGAALLVIAGIISYGRAGQKHLALVGTLDFLGLIVYFLLLSQVLTRHWHSRLVLCTIAATGAMVLAKAAYQVGVEVPETIEYFKQYHAADMAQRLGPEGLGRMYDFERRLEGGAARGYFAHSNVFGSFLILVVMACLALARDRWRRTPFGSLIVPLLLAGAAVVALAGSQSKGAVAALAIAVLIFAIGESVSPRLTSPRGRPSAGLIATSVWIGMLAAAIGLIAALHHSPTALGRSMLFRWMYWQGAARILSDQGIWGVGANNFGRFFPKYKSVECPEEVQDPHSWPVRLVTEWGVPGLLGGMAVFIGVTIFMVRRARTSATPSKNSAPHNRLEPDRSTLPSDAGASQRSLVLWLAAIGAIAVGGLWASMAGADVGFVAGSLFLAGMPWVIGFLTVGLESSTPKVSNDTPVVIGSAVCAGLIGFLLHAGVDLALFWPGASTTFFAMMALATAQVALNQPATPVVASRPRRGPAMALAFVGAFALAVYFGRIVGPAVAVGAALETARIDPGPPTWEQYALSGNRRAYEAAIVAEPRDSTALDELLEALVARSRSLAHVDDAQRRVPELRARDPYDAAADHYDATLHIQRFVLDHDLMEMDRALAAMHNVVNGYPTAPDSRIALAEMYQKLFATTGTPTARDAAIEQYQTALSLDEARIYVSPLNRYTPQRRAELERRIEQLRTPPVTTSQPR